MKPYIVVEGPDTAVDHALRQVRAAGWETIRGWSVSPGSQATVCTGRVTSAVEAGRALLAAVNGAGVVIHADADREVIDRLCDDLRRFGRVDHRIGPPPEGPPLSADDLTLVRSLLEGATLAEAAWRLHVSRRTADRRLAAIRRSLGVETTAEALTALRRDGVA